MTLPRAILSLLLLAPPAIAAKAYPDPEAAVGALVEAARAGEIKPVLSILGEPSKSYLSSGDAVADRAALARFVDLYDSRHELASPDEKTRTLSIGDDSWPFPIPLIKGKSGWSFDAKAGEHEILARRVGRNELDVIQVCFGYVSAQQDYLSMNPDGAAVPHYADRLMSTEGKRDGLYWKTGPGEAESPMGPAVSGALAEGYAPKPGQQAPYHGYLYRILTAQGAHAEGGALDYRENGQLTRGFALIAWPASYRKSGVMTFLVNQNGVVFQKDLGSNTARLASSMKSFDPGDGWKPVEQ